MKGCVSFKKSFSCVPGGGKDAPVDSAEGGAGHKEGHDPAHHAQQPVAKCLEIGINWHDAS